MGGNGSQARAPGVTLRQGAGYCRSSPVRAGAANCAPDGSFLKETSPARCSALRPQSTPFFPIPPFFCPSVRALTAVNPFIHRYKWHFLGGVLFVLLSTLLTIFPAQLVRYAFDLVSEGIDLYHLFAGTRAQSGVYDLFGRNVLFYGVLIIVLALLRVSSCSSCARHSSSCRA